MDAVALLGTVAAVLTTAAFVPQAYKTIRTRATKGLSVATFGMLFVGTLFWFAYGYAIGDVPIMVANAITSALNAAILFIKLQSLVARRRGGAISGGGA